ncbi:hypothetical protein [Mycobacterium genavense]|uniref:hypothetical protein n=1 Tax=Mycobacterium genavense TaxID=36812 RepID=UPI0004AD9714|nr:hypothetical protein [Mycobacterium genavense]
MYCSTSEQPGEGRSADASHEGTLAHIALGRNRGRPAADRLPGRAGHAPHLDDSFPAWLAWFGRPGSMPTLLVVVCVLIWASVLNFRSGSHRVVGISFSLTAALVPMTAILGLTPYWGCHDANHPAFFTPLMATASLVKGDTGDFCVGGKTCPNPTPVGLELARIAALSAIFTGLGGAVVGFSGPKWTGYGPTGPNPSRPSSVSTVTPSRCSAPWRAPWTGAAPWSSSPAPATIACSGPAAWAPA